jgi:hypothetical protein
MQRNNTVEARKLCYSIRIAGPSSLNSANDAFLNPAFTSSFSIPTSFVQIHVDAYMFTLRTY